MKSALCVLVCMASGASVAYGNTPLTSAYIGTDYLTMTGWDSSFTGCGSLGCGGEFGGVVNPATDIAGGVVTNPNISISTNFWCVDAQEDFSWGDSGFADVVPLTGIKVNDPDVQYSNVSNSGSSGPEWAYTPSNSPVALPSGAQARYEMAAWLIQQYAGFADSITGAPQNTDIQMAIWDITSNSTYAVDTEYAPAPATAPDVWNWVKLAAECYDSACSSSTCVTINACANGSSLNGGNWAVVSWSTDAAGALDAEPDHQTFLVQIVPEPGFYGVLGLGMAGLIFGASRKKKKVRTQPFPA